MNEALRQAVQQVADWQNKTPEALLAEVTAISYVKKSVDQRVWSIAGIAKEFGTTIAETIYAAIAGAGLTGLAARFAAAGLDATDPQWLTTADALIAGPLSGLPAETKEAIKYIGHNAVKLYGGTATAQDVATAKTQVTNRLAIEALRADIENTYINPAIADGVSTVADVVATIKAGL